MLAFVSLFRLLRSSAPGVSGGRRPYATPLLLSKALTRPLSGAGEGRHPRLIPLE